MRADAACPHGQPAIEAGLCADDAFAAGDPSAALDDAVWRLSRRTPQFSARCVVTRRQRAILLGLAGGLGVAFLLAPRMTPRLIFAFLSLVYVLSALFRWALAIIPQKRMAAAAPLRDCDLPVYTVLAPLYREAQALPGLARALRALDYPPDRLDVKLVVEADDGETLRAARRLGSPFEIVIVPPGGPRTKPKACNYALAFARGALLVIYDAEDRPQPDQLRKAASAFHAAPSDMACLQARLAFHNEDVNWLTRMFAIDYALWFEVLLPGLDRLGAPIPLGGTSNHFRTALLRLVGAWDAFNVTEDADLGIRLSRLGWRVGMLDSVTLEECPARLGAWLRQRSRWLKGYMQTYLVHMRAPLSLARRLGPAGFLAFQLFVGGGVVFALVNPLLWAAVLFCAVHGGAPLGPGFAVVPGTGLLVSDMLLTWMATSGPRRDLAAYGLTVVAYWVLVSVAGYRGLCQLVRRPFYWDKTQHGPGPG